MAVLIHVGLFITAFSVSCTVCQNEIPVLMNTSGKTDPALYKPTVAAAQTSGLKTLVNCSLVPKFPDIRDHIAALAVENKLIKVKVNIIGAQGPLNDTYPVSVYKPNQWIISTSLTGNSMLMLKEYFDAMSLRTLGYGVSSASLTLIQEPINCLENAHVENIENSLRLHFLTNFEAEESQLPEEALICNAHVIRGQNSEGRISYICCSLTLGNTLQCSELKESVWFKLLFISISIVQVLIVLYSPYLMPDSVYKAGNVFRDFVFNIEPEKFLKFNVKKVTDKKHIDSGFVKTVQLNFAELKELKSKLSTLVPGKVYTMYVKRVDLAVRGSKIIAEGNAPVGIWSFVRNFFIRCNLRFKVSSVKECCNQDMCTLLPCKMFLPWYRCLGFIMMIVVTAIMTLPWILRILFYYVHEEESIQHQMRVLQNRNLTFPYTSSMLTYLSPTHSLYIGIYIFILAESILYMFLPETIKRQLKLTIGQCIRDMRSTPKLDACGFFVAHMLWPLNKFGVLGCLVLPIWLLVLPLCLVYLALEVLPIANLSVRLLVNALYYTIKTVAPKVFSLDVEPSEGKCLCNWVKNRFDSILVLSYYEKHERRNQIIQAVSLILSFVTMWAFLFIVIDCIAFYVECAIYALIGFILNPGDTMKYVSLILLIAVYGNECFSGVHTKYAAFSKAISTEVQTMVGDQVAEVASKAEAEQENAAFRLPNPNVNSERMHFQAGSERFLKWKADRLVLLLDKSDIPYIPKPFLFKLGTLNHHFCPGEIHLLYLKALLDFSLILVFLLFVFIVIFAFGQAHDISSGGQTIAALGSGFLPLVMRKFLFQTHASSGVDKSNLKWKNMFVYAVQNFATRWNFTDIHIAHVEEFEANSKAHESRDTYNADNLDLEISAADSGEDESSVRLLEKSTPINEDSLMGNIDLLVKTVTDAKGKELMTFYVRNDKVDNTLTDVTVVVCKGKPDEETKV